MRASVYSRISSRLRPVLVLALAACLSATGVPAEPAAALGVADQPTTAMKTFVIIFRQGPRTLTDAEKERRAEETSVWARRTNEAGHELNPHILAPEREVRGAEGSVVTQADAWPVTAILMLEARDLTEAAAIAEAHPALRYGAVVEVRPWARPVPVAAPAKPGSPAS